METVTDPAEAPAPTPPEATAQLLDATIAAMVQERVAQALAAIQPPTAAAGSLFVTNPASLPPLPEAAPTPLELVTVPLPPRFMAYVRTRAEAFGEDVPQHVATMVRAFWQNDPWRHLGTAPTGLGQPAGTSRVL